MKLKFAWIAAIAVAGYAASDSLDRSVLAKIRPRMQEFVDQGTASGFVTLVARHDRVIDVQAIGWQDREAKTPMRPDTIFQIQSMTKGMVCAAVMTLADEGRLSINDPAEKYLPEFKTLKMPDGGKLSHPPTIRELMTHTSGINGGLSKGFERSAHTLAEVVADAAAQPMQFDPGTKWSYNGNGIASLGRILEVVSGKSFEAFMRERLFVPLAMVDSHFFLPANKTGRLAALYTDDHGTLKRSMIDTLRKGWKYPAPEGGLYSTAADVARFYQMMLSRGQLNGSRILSPAAVELMTTMQTGDFKVGFAPGMGYGLGLGVVKDVSGMFRYSSIGTFGHGGAYRTYVFADPKRDLIGIILYQRTNVGGDQADEQTAFIQLANAALR